MKNRICKINPKKICVKKIRLAADILRNGGLVAFPTETVYGLGANAFDSYAIARIFEVKNRPRFDPLIVHIHSEEDMNQLCLGVDERAKSLMKKFWPGPLTFILQKSDRVPDIVTAGLQTVAVRMPSHPVAQALIKEIGTPIAAPSANPFGYLSPTTAQHVLEQLGEKVDLILDGGECVIGVESTVLDFTRSKPTLLRPGGLPIEDIEQIIGDVGKNLINSKKPRSPGQLPCHYAPRTPLKIFDRNKVKIPVDKRVGILAFTPLKEKLPCEMIEILSSNGDLHEATANFFSSLHRLDAAGLDVIYAESVDEIGLGRAIMDRLRRAATHRSSC